MGNRIANRYAKAFIDTVGDIKEVPKIISFFHQFEALLNENTQLKTVLTSRFYPVDKQKQIVVEVLKKMKGPEMASRYLTLLVGKRRLPELAEISKRFEILYLAKSGVVPIEVWSRKAVKEHDKEELEKKFSKHFGKEVKAYYQVNPELIGGLKVEALGKAYDGSVLSSLKNFEERRIGGV